MIVTNTVVTLTWELNKTATAYAETDFDLLIVAPDGTAVFDDDLTQTAFTAPTVDSEGSIASTYTFTQEGLYAVSLCTGTASAYTIHSKKNVSVVAPESVITIPVINLP